MYGPTQGQTVEIYIILYTEELRQDYILDTVNFFFGRITFMMQDVSLVSMFKSTQRLFCHFVGFKKYYWSWQKQMKNY